MKSGQNISWRGAFVEDLSDAKRFEVPKSVRFQNPKSKPCPSLTKTGNRFVARVLVPGTAAYVEVVLHGIMNSTDAHKALEVFHCGLQR
jgi:hypothetical protein